MAISELIRNGIIFRILEISFHFGMNFSVDFRGAENGDIYIKINRKRNNFPDFRDFILFRDEFPIEFKYFQKMTISILNN